MGEGESAARGNFSVYTANLKVDGRKTKLQLGELTLGPVDKLPEYAGCQACAFGDHRGISEMDAVQRHFKDNPAKPRFFPTNRFSFHP